MYKIHIESGRMVEDPPIEIVQTKEEARAALQALVSRGITNVYAVGYDPAPSPLAELG